MKLKCSNFVVLTVIIKLNRLNPFFIINFNIKFYSNQGLIKHFQLVC